MLYNYLNSSAVEKLRKPEKFSSIDHSTLSAKLQPYWIWVSENIVPTWMAPNLITTMGGLAVILCYLLLVLFDTSGSTESSILYLLTAFGIFFFQTADAVDGKQARKTGSSSVLGDYLDHVGDIVAISFCIMATCHALKITNGWLLILVALAVGCSEFLLHWETSNTGMLVLPNGSSITEGQLLMIALLTIAYFLPGLSPFSFFGLFTIGEVVVVAGVVVIAVGAAITSVKRVLSLGPRARPGTFSHLIPLVLGVVSVLIYALFGPRQLFSDKLHLIAFLWCIHCMIINFSGMMVIHRLSDQPFPMVPPGLVPVLALAINVLLGELIPANLMLALAFVAAVSIATHYFVSVIVQIATALHLPIFTLPARRAER